MQDIVRTKSRPRQQKREPALRRSVSVWTACHRHRPRPRCSARQHNDKGRAAFCSRKGPQFKAIMAKLSEILAESPISMFIRVMEAWPGLKVS